MLAKITALLTLLIEKISQALQELSKSEAKEITSGNVGSSIPKVGEVNNESSEKSWKKDWQEFVEDYFIKNSTTFLQASDIERIYPRFRALPLPYQASAFAEFIKWTAYYESSWNINSSSVDAGTVENKDTWSVGLLQVSVIDQKNHKLSTSFNYEDLKKGIPNLTLGLLILKNQIIKRGKFFLKKGEPGLYWSVLCDGGKYDKLPKILPAVHKLKFSISLPPETKLPVSDITPWVTIARKEVGIKEIPGDKDSQRIVEYHSVTKLKAIDDETPWCASFVSWCLEKSGYKSTKSAWAKDYLTYGTKLDRPTYGCIVVFTRGSIGGHVAFYMKDNGDYVTVLGGNQGDEVCVADYPKAKVIGYVWPKKKDDQISTTLS